MEYPISQLGVKFGLWGLKKHHNHIKYIHLRLLVEFTKEHDLQK
jgi:hypothetical protein